ncbi:RebB family R body protein [Gallaecimonas xiamenensis]|uniref:R body protein RebB-like protein n=1 Tax=Gallaecimonas xiamenensis 3-C-1 TaxID=745411 RepID=K2IXC2_9GAMM|nr:R body protein RebB-like protein [Gallaecimonas xiamenensis 3-C-1]
MSANTSVNTQITDTVSQSNVKVIADAPAVAVANIYQAMAHAIGLSFENAVNAQNQQAVVSQAATTQGVIQIYSLDTATSAEGVKEMLGTSADRVQAASLGGVNTQIMDAIQQSLRAVVDSAGDVSFAVRSAAEAMQTTLNDISAANYRGALHTLQLAATATCLRLMLADPTQADAYAKVLEEVRSLA